MSEKKLKHVILNESIKSCHSKVEVFVEKCTFNWSIENFSLYYTNFDAGQYIYSSAFSTGVNPYYNLEWKLGLMPSISVKNTEYVGVYLQLCRNNLESNTNKGRGVIKLKIEIKNTDDDTLHEKSGEYSLNDFRDVPNGLCGWDTFVDKEGLLYEIGGLGGDVLKLCCIMEIMHKATLSEVKFDSMDSRALKRKLSTDLKALFDNPQHSDVILRTKNGDFQAHRAILSARSIVFSGMFNHNMKESQDNIVCISDISGVVLKAMLQFIYCGRIDKISSSHYPELYCAADKYCLLDLKTKCSKKLSDILSLENWYLIANLADLHDEKSLYSAISNFIESHYGDVVTSVQWAQLVLEKPEFVVKLTKPRLRNQRDEEYQSESSYHSSLVDSDWESDF